MAYQTVRLTSHAIRRLRQRAITLAEVEEALQVGQTIAMYHDDEPPASYLVLAHVAGRPLHIVAADDDEAQCTIVITAYQPERHVWDASFRRRIRP